MTTDPTLTPADLAILTAQLARLRVIERAAWHALDLAKGGYAMDAYSVLSEALEPRADTSREPR